MEPESHPVYEKLGAFYLGQEFDLDARSRTGDLVLYDSKDLVTHAVIVGMTGSGKTGLGIGLLEEAAIDSVPALVIDPKGDLTNLLLNFPELLPTDFAPWVHADDAKRQGITVEQLATETAEQWRSGLAEWEQQPARIARLRDAAEFQIFTPGSDAGQPVSILSSFAAPSPQVCEDQDLFRDRITTTANSLLGLLGIDTDPLRSREHILITRILSDTWNRGEDLNLGSLIRLVQDPPFELVGVMDLESFYPSKERFELAMALNNLLAAPSFSAWLEGVPLNVDQLLHSPNGKPRISVFSISHLSDSERMFFVSLLLNETLGWMRSQSGTTSLRALLYIDEIFGYMPPVAEPPSKRPLLTLLKQARAFGLGVVLSTQNPVDLDYKGLSNAGTWFLGRLQTERDKRRVLDGLEGATRESGEDFDRATISEILSKVGKRVFLMHNVHESAPVVFQTRWALSYLAGPLTRDQIRRLSEEHRPAEAPPAGQTVRERPLPADLSAASPALSPAIEQRFMRPTQATGKQELYYVPHLIALTKVHFADTRRGLAADEELELLVDVENDTVDWANAIELSHAAASLEKQSAGEGRFAPIPELLSNAKSFGKLDDELSDYLYHNRRYSLFKSSQLGRYSKPGECVRDFRIRLTHESHEERDECIDALRKKYASRLRTATDRVERAELAVDRETSEADQAQMDSMISIGSSILNAVLGRKSVGVSRSARGLGRASKQKQDIRRAETKLESYRERLEELESELRAEVEEIRREYDPETMELETIQLKPRRGDIDIRLLAVAWVPMVAQAETTIRPA